MSTAMIEARGVGKSFGTHRVLRGVDLDVGRSEVVCLIGPSGSGKSTLLRCINFLEAYDDGEVRIEGELIGYEKAPDGKRRRKLAAPLSQVARRVQHTLILFGELVSVLEELSGRKPPSLTPSSPLQPVLGQGRPAQATVGHVHVPHRS